MSGLTRDVDGPEAVPGAAAAAAPDATDDEPIEDPIVTALNAAAADIADALRQVATGRLRIAYEFVQDAKRSLTKASGILKP